MPTLHAGLASEVITYAAGDNMFRLENNFDTPLQSAAAQELPAVYLYDGADMAYRAEIYCFSSCTP